VPERVIGHSHGKCGRIGQRYVRCATSVSATVRGNNKSEEFGVAKMPRLKNLSLAILQKEQKERVGVYRWTDHDSGQTRDQRCT
jgi:hypothetical protein